MCVPLFIRGTDERGKNYLDFATAVNVSSGGALIAIRRPGKIESKITVELPASPIPEFEEVIAASRTMEGRIVRVDSANRYSLWAVAFDQPLN